MSNLVHEKMCTKYNFVTSTNSSKIGECNRREPSEQMVEDLTWSASEARFSGECQHWSLNPSVQEAFLVLADSPPCVGFSLVPDNTHLISTFHCFLWFKLPSVFPSVKQG